MRPPPVTRCRWPSRRRRGPRIRDSRARERAWRIPVIDHLLPVVQLIKSHYDIELAGFARYYFYAHKLMGYVLASFLIAGLAGLTQK